MFKGLSNLGNLLKQAQQFGGQMEKLTEELKNRRATGAAGGGMIEVEINGAMELLRCRIDPQLIAQGDRELIEDLVVAAVNQALVNAKKMHAEALKDMTGGLQLPGLQEALEKLGGIEGPENA
ncbi:MAG: YbaB/EbfC family nucleoid-associated protein [Thermoguttaceae bacterium]|jgi:DNA-binding YbaB/EbfC family protein